MAGSAFFPRVEGATRRQPRLIVRHSAVVRITHWINTIAFFGLLVSGIAILLAHPRLYWGETGNVGTPSLIDLPLPFVLVGQSGWGRSLHFLSAWFCILNGLLYVLSGFLTRHFQWKHSAGSYNASQRIAYLVVVAILFPLMIWTGLAMSPAITSVFPAFVTGLGGQQSARTIHFFIAAFLVLFLLAHVTMVCFAGFTSHVRAMITGKYGQ
jgi:thiosulfate reductase cytochrome b subunit